MSSCLFQTKFDDKEPFGLRPEDHLRPQDVFSDIQVLQRHLMDTLKLGSTSAHACAELFISCLVDSIVVFEALTVKELNSVLSKDSTIPSAAKDVIVKHFEAKTSSNKDVKDTKDDEKPAKKTEEENDAQIIENYLVETVGLGNTSAEQCAKVLTASHVDSVAVLTNLSKSTLEGILVEPNVSKLTKETMLLKLFPESKSSSTTSTATAAATTTTVEVNKEDVAVLKTFLTQQVKLSAEGAQNCAELFVKTHIDSVKILLRLSTNEVNAILDSTDVPPATRSLVLDSLQKAPRSSPKMTNEEKQKMIAKAMDDAQKIMDEVSKTAEKQSKENKANLDGLTEGMNATASKANLTADTPSKDTILKEVDQAGKKTEGNKTVTTGNYANVYEMANCMSDGALRKGVNFINGLGFGSRAACPLFDFVETSKKFTDIGIMLNPKIEYKDIICYSSEAQSSFETAQKSGMTANSYSVKMAGFYGGVAGAITSNGSLATNTKSESTSISKTTGYSSYKTTSTIVKMNSFQVNLSKVCLDAMAIQDFKNVTSEGAAEQFLMNYGSHVLLTPHSTGGIFNSTASVTFQSEVKETDHSQALAQSQTFRGAIAVVSPFAGGSAAYENKEAETEASTQKKLDEKTSYTLSYTAKTIGPQVLQFGAFYEALAANTKTHCLVANGLNMSDPATWAAKPVWELALEAAEFKDDASIIAVANFLRDAWLRRVLTHRSGTLLENFMSYLVNRTLNSPLKGEAANWALVWRDKFNAKLLGTECDPFCIPTNNWCIIANDVGTVLEIPYGNNTKGTKLWVQAINTKNNRDSQVWRLTPEGYIESISGLVIELPKSSNGEADKGKSVQLAEKTNEKNQKFFFNKDRQLVTHADTEYCLDVSNGTTAGGERVITWQRHNNSNQKWRFFPVSPTTELRYVNDWYTIRPAAQISKCLEVSGGSAEACTAVVLTEQAKTTSVAQMWRLTPEGYFESQVHPEFKMTLAIKDGNLVTSPSLYLYPKLNGDTQKWFFDANGRLISDASRTQALEVNAKGEFKFSPINLTLVTQKWKLCPSDVRPIPTDITDKWCFVQCDEYSHLVLEVKNSGKADGTGIGGNQLVGTDNQIWRLTKQGRLESKLKAGFFLQYKDLSSNESLEMTSRIDLVNEVKWTFNMSEGVLSCAKDTKAVMDMFTSLDYKADELRRIGMQSKNGRDNQKWTFIPTDSV